MNEQFTAKQGRRKRKMDQWCGGMWRRDMNIMPRMWTLSQRPIVFQEQNTCFKKNLARNSNTMKLTKIQLP